MDHYKTWFSGLKRALLYQDIQTLHSTTKIAATILSGIPEEVRGSTFVGQPGLLKILSNLQRALGSGRNADNLKTALSNQIRQWEQKKTTSTPTAFPVSPSSSSPSTNESSHGSKAVDFATRQMRMCPESSTGHYQSTLAPVPLFSEANAPLATFLQQMSESVPREGLGAPCENCSVCASCWECMPFRDAVGRATEAKNSVRDSSENFAAEMKKCNVRSPGNCRLTQTSTDQQLLVAKYQELDALIDLLREHVDQWTRKLAQDTNWRIAVDRKLQTIVNVLGCSIAGDNLGFWTDQGRRAP